MKGGNTLIIEKIISYEESEELNVHRFAPGSLDQDPEYCEIIKENGADLPSEYSGAQMPIPELEEIICRLKSQGCNFVSMFYHSDHDQYCFTGVHRRFSTGEEFTEAQRSKILERLKRTREKIETLDADKRLMLKQIEILEQRLGNL